MDIKALISAVYCRPPIWNKRDKQYANRSIIENLWIEIATELECDEALLRKKWKYLRDNFAVEYTKQQNPRSEKAVKSCPPSKWQYFNQLMFLRDIVTLRVPKSSFKSSPGSSVQGASPEYDDSDFEVDLNSSFSPQPHLQACIESESRNWEEEGCPPPIPPPHPRVMKKERDTEGDGYYGRHFESEEKKRKHPENKPKKNEEESEDLDLMFYKCLLPHIREIPKNLKLEYQNRVQSLVQEYAYQRPKSKEVNGQNPGEN